MTSPLKNLLAWLRNPLHLIAVLLSLMPIYLVYLYIATYARPVPINDQWLEPLEIAIAVHNGSFTLEDITQETYGHRAVFSYGLTALVSYSTHWQVMIEVYVIFGLALLRFGLLVLLFHDHLPQLTPLVLLPFSLLVFSAYQYLVWLCGVYSVWHFVSLFALAAVVVLKHYPVGWRPLLAAAFFAFCATFSQGSGTVTFLVLLLTLWMFGYRRPLYYAFWIAATVFSLGLYFGGSSITLGGETSATSSTLNFENREVLARFVLAYIGNPFTNNLDMELPQGVGGVGMALLLANLSYLWMRRRDWSQLAAWVTLVGFNLAIAMTVFASRFRPDRFIYAIEQRYALVSTNFWAAFAAVAILAGWVYWHERQPKGYARLLLGVNGLFLLMLAGLYAQANIWNWQVTAKRFDHAVGYDDADLNEAACIRDFPLRRDMTCLKQTYPNQLGNATDEQIYQLAAYELTIFADQETRFVLPSSYKAGSPILLDTESRWLNIYVRDWMLDGIDEETLFHVAPPEQQFSTQDLPVPPQNLYADWSGETPTRFIEFIGQAQQVWYLYTSRTGDHAAQVDALLKAHGYSGLSIPITDPRYQNTDFLLYRYLRLPENAQDLYRFGDDISLQAWSVHAPDPLNACQAIQVESWWKTLAVPDFNYSATLILVNAAGVKVAQTDGSLAGIEMQVWTPNLLYLDERTLSLPCDLPKGDYHLQIGLYNFQNLEDLPILSKDGEAIGTRLTLASFTIR